MCCLGFPSTWEPSVLPEGGAGREQAASCPDPWPSFRLVLSKATGPDTLTGASMFIGQIFHCVLPHSGLLWSCQCLPFIKNGGSSWDRMLPHYLRLWFKPHVLRKLAPILFLFWLLPALSQSHLIAPVFCACWKVCPLLPHTSRLCI